MQLSHGANLLGANKIEGVASHAPPTAGARASMSTMPVAGTAPRLPADAAAQEAPAGKLRYELLEAVDMPESRDPDNVGEVLEHVKQVLGSSEPDDKERALAFL